MKVKVEVLEELTDSSTSVDDGAFYEVLNTELLDVGKDFAEHRQLVKINSDEGETYFITEFLTSVNSRLDSPLYEYHDEFESGYITVTEVEPKEVTEVHYVPVVK